jgi:hypothetical protein
MKYLVALVFCLFMGMTAISLGFGAIFPSLNEITRPLVCANGQMSHRMTRRSSGPGRMTRQTEWTCVDPSGVYPIGLLEVTLYAGTFWGLILFVVLAGLLKIFGPGPQRAITGGPLDQQRLRGPPRF